MIQWRLYQLIGCRVSSWNERLLSVFYVARFLVCVVLRVGKFCEVTSFFSCIEQKIHRYNNVIMPREYECLRFNTPECFRCLIFMIGVVED